MRRSLSGQEREGGMDGWSCKWSGAERAGEKMSFGSYLELNPTCFSVEMHVCTCAARDLVDRLDLNNGRNDILDACVV